MAFKKPPPSPDADRRGIDNLLGDLPDSDKILEKSTFSFYPAGTRRDLRVVLAAAAVFVVVINHYRRLEQIRRLLITIVIIGAAVALLALAQDITGATHIFWRGPPGRGRANAGPFFAYSHYGQFMNLCVGAGIGLLLVEFHKIFQRVGLPGSAPLKPLFDVRHRTAWILGLFILVGVVTVFLSGSRGAMIGLLIALGLATATLSGTRGLEGSAWFVIPLVVTGCAVVLFFGPSVIFDRFSTLENPRYYSDRLQIIKDLTVEWKQFPIVGTGLGTHEVIYPIYDHSARIDTATHAENEYAQAMEETGAGGVVMLLVFAGIIWNHYFRATRNADPPIRLAGIGLGIGLAAVQVHSLSDFGQHLPANACMTAVFCGLLISLSRLRQFQRHQLKAMGGQHPVGGDTGNSSADASSHDDLPHGHSSPDHHSYVYEESDKRGGDSWRRARRGVLLAGVCAICWWQVRSAFNDYRAESHWNHAYGLELFLAPNGWEAPNATYADLLNETTLACTFAPDDVRYRYSLNAYRWHAITRVHDPGTNQLVYNASTIEYASAICEDLKQTRLLCPTYSHALLLQGEIEFTPLLNDPAGPDHIRLAFKLARCDPTAAGMTARCDVSESLWDESEVHFRRFLELAGDFRDVVDIYIVQNQRPDIALKLAGNNVANLTKVANAVAATDPALAAEARKRAFDALKVQASRADAPASLLATLAEQHAARGNYAGAIAAYRRALAIEYVNPAWHMALARLLAHEGEFPEAIHEVRVCLLRHHDDEDARQLLSELEAAAEKEKLAAVTTRPTTRPTTTPATTIPATEPTTGPTTESSGTP